MSTTPDSKQPGITFGEIIELSEACSRVNGHFGRLLDAKHIDTNTTRVIARMLLAHDVGLAGHNYGDKGRNILAVLRSPTTSETAAV